MNLSRAMMHKVTSIQAFPKSMIDNNLVGDSKVNQERYINAMRLPLLNDYLIHHTGFMQDALPDGTRALVNKEEDTPQYYSPENAGYFDETWNWLKEQDGTIHPSPVNGMLQAAPVRLPDVEMETDPTIAEQNMAALPTCAPIIKDDDGNELAPESITKDENGNIILLCKNINTGEPVRITYVR
jgi:hypothetical protein